jgi:pyrroloquinoline quinone biosynthesis protein E
MDSPAMNKYRGESWMREPCRTCPERGDDFGGCRCQAYMLTGDAANADPVCDKSPHHNIVLDVIKVADKSSDALPELVFRNPQNSRELART